MIYHFGVLGVQKRAWALLGIVITPRNYAFNFRHVGDMKNHYAIIGMAHVAEDYPLYYDAMR